MGVFFAQGLPQIHFETEFGDDSRDGATITVMKLVIAARVVMALVLLWDIPVVGCAAVLLAKGGTRAVHGWVVHIALMGRVFDTSLAEQQRLIRGAYAMFFLMVFCVPCAALPHSTMARIQNYDGTDAVTGRRHSFWHGRALLGR